MAAKDSKPDKNISDALVAIQALNACRILVVNGKGGAGKTTLSTNIAAWFAHRGEATALLDADPQGSSSYWIKQRAPELPQVYGLKMDANSRTMLSFQLRAPKSTRWLVTDAPPGLTGMALDDLVKQHDIVIIPVMSSDIDIRASARFIGELLLTRHMRQKRLPLAVIANRVRPQTNAWENLQKFLLSLQIPYPTTLRDSQNYVRAYSEGRGIVNYPQQSHLRDRQDLLTLLEWIDEKNAELQRIKTSTNDAQEAEDNQHNNDKTNATSSLKERCEILLNSQNLP